MVKALSTPQVIINNQTLAIVPNSFAFTEGKGESKTRAASTGGGGVQTVHSVDASTKITKVKFAVYPTQENIELLREIKDNEDANVISWTDAAGMSRTAQNASLDNDYEVPLAADGEISVEFGCDPAV